MTKELWINIPVKDLKKAKEFFLAIGFKANGHDVPDMVGILAGNVNVMLCSEKLFSSFNNHPIADTSKGSEVLFSFDAESREEIDELAKKVEKAGGTLFGKPAEMQGWMYGFGFVDLDGHRWNGLYMDFSKMPK